MSQSSLFSSALAALRAQAEAADASMETHVELALLTRALGYDYQETKEEWSEKTGQRSTTVTHHVGPDVRAQIFWLKNRCPGRWRERPEMPEAAENSENEVKIIDDL